MSHPTLADIRTEISAHIAEPISTTGWFTPTNIRTFINTGIEAVFLKIAAVDPGYFGLKRATFGYVAGQREYSLSTVAPFEIKRVEVTDTGSDPLKLSETTFEDRILSTGEPTAYYWYVNTQVAAASDPELFVGFDYIPDRTATDNVVLWYVGYPRKLVDDTDKPDLPLEAVQLATLWATMLALRSDQKSGAEVQTEFNFRLANLLSFVGRGRSGGPVYVNYIDDGW